MRMQIILVLGSLLLVVEALHAQSRGEVVDLGYTGDSRPTISGNWILFSLREEREGRDLNGDGDKGDDVLHARSLDDGRTINTGEAGSTNSTFFEAVSEDRLAFLVSEESQGNRDLNGDGDSIDHVLHVYDLESGLIANLAVASRAQNYRWVGASLIYVVSESQQGQDLNDDGEADDRVLFERDLRSATTKQIATLAPPGPCTFFCPSFKAAGKWVLFPGPGHQDQLYNTLTDATTVLRLTTYGPQGDDNHLAFGVSESLKGKDLNGDGDETDRVIHVYDMESELATSLKLAGDVASVSRGQVFFWVSESEQGGIDLNGDNDTADQVLHTHDLQKGETINSMISSVGQVSHEAVVSVFDSILQAHSIQNRSTTDLGPIFDGPVVFERWVAFRGLHGETLYDIETGGVFDLYDALDFDPGGLVLDFPFRSQKWLYFENFNRDAIGWRALDLEALSRRLPFRRGDCNADGIIDVTDPVSSLQFQFTGTFDPPCLDACDYDNDGIIDVSDAIANLTHQFVGGPPPAPPGKEACGADPILDGLSCESFAACAAGG